MLVLVVEVLPGEAPVLGPGAKCCSLEAMLEFHPLLESYCPSHIPNRRKCLVSANVHKITKH